MALILSFVGGAVFGVVITAIVLAALSVASGTEIVSGVDIVETGPPTLRPVEDQLLKDGELIEDYFDRIQTK